MGATALTAWRYTLLLIVAAETLMQAGAAFWLRQYREPVSASAWGLLAESSVATFLLLAITLLSLWFFLGSRASLAAGFVAILGMKLSAESFATVFSVHNMDFYQGGAMLLGVVIGESYARLRGIDPGRSRAEWWEARRFGMTGALGMLAGSYMAAGSSKLFGGGIAWATSSALRLMLISHTEVDGPAWAVTIPRWTADSPLLCMGLEAGTLIIQLGTFSLLLGPRIRQLWAALIVAFHTGIWLTSHILFVSPLVFSAAVAFPWGFFRRRPVEVLADEVEEAQRRPVDRPLLLFLIAAVVLATYAALTGTWLPHGAEP